MRSLYIPITKVQHFSVKSKFNISSPVAIDGRFSDKSQLFECQKRIFLENQIILGTKFLAKKNVTKFRHFAFDNMKNATTVMMGRSVVFKY